MPPVLPCLNTTWYGFVTEKQPYESQLKGNSRPYKVIKCESIFYLILNNYPQHASDNALHFLYQPKCQVKCANNSVYGCFNCKINITIYIIPTTESINEPSVKCLCVRAGGYLVNSIYFLDYDYNEYDIFLMLAILLSL